MNEKVHIDERIAGNDWANVFAYCGPREAEVYGNGLPSISGVLGYAGSVDGFTRADVAEVIAASDGENDERNWICAVRLEDGRFAFVSAGCDYTGWG